MKDVRIASYHSTLRRLDSPVLRSKLPLVNADIASAWRPVLAGALTGSTAIAVEGAPAVALPQVGR